MSVRDQVVAAAVEWEAAHAALSVPPKSDISSERYDADALERYSQACVELLAVVSQNRDALAATEEAGDRA